MKKARQSDRNTRSTCHELGATIEEPFPEPVPRAPAPAKPRTPLDAPGAGALDAANTLYSPPSPPPPPPLPCPPALPPPPAAAAEVGADLILGAAYAVFSAPARDLTRVAQSEGAPAEAVGRA